MLKQTALLKEHQNLNGKMVDFGGWELPVQYAGANGGVLNEHLAVRTAAGLFDVSHMGEILIEGPDAERFVDYLVTNDVTALAVFQAQYSAMCNEHGGIVDDLVIYKLESCEANEQKYFLVVNASNTEKDFEHIKSVQKMFLEKNPTAKFCIENESSIYSQIAIQGPKAQEILQRTTSVDLSEIKTYWCKPGNILHVDSLIARTGYTGEDGFELYVPWSHAPEIWKALLASGASEGIVPCGLGARDTLRLEMKYALYGHELSDHTSPLETGLAWVTKLNKTDFFGKEALLKQKTAGIKKTLVGVKSLGRAIPRQGYEVFSSADAIEQNKIGVITSGTSSPSLKYPIGVAFINKTHEATGARVFIKIREDVHEFEIVKTPFLKHT